MFSAAFNYRFNLFTVLSLVVALLPSESTAVINEFSPIPDDWSYVGNRCESDKAFPSEAAAMEGGIARYSGCNNDAYIREPGVWGTLQAPW